MRSRYLILFVLFFLHGNLFSQVKREFLFDAFMNGISPLHNGQNMNIWGFQRLLPDSSEKLLPSPTILCELGDTVEITMINNSVEGHTIHLHGLDVDQANDGVPATSFFIQPGSSGTYSFVATHTGNYMYHCHVTSVMHVQLGMYGMLIVESPGGLKELYPGGPSFVKDYSWMGAEIDKSWHDDYTTIGAFTNFFPDFFQISGKGRQRLWEDSALSIYNARVGEPIYLRLMNIGFGIQEYIFPSGLDVKAHMSDGRPLPGVVAIDTLNIYPGERYGLIMRPLQFMQDSIKVNFKNMLRHQVWDSESIPIGVNGIYGISDQNIDEISSIHPNPNDGRFWLKFDQERDWESYSIFDYSGKNLVLNAFLEEPDETGRVPMEFSLPPGSYILILYSKKSFRTEKFIIHNP